MPAGVRSSPGEALVEAWRHFVSHETHDLNNHLAAILGRAELALMSDDPVRWRRGLQETLDAGQPLRTLLADLKQVTLWQTIAPAPAPLADILALAGRLVRPALRRVSIDLVVDGNTESAMVEHPGSVALALWLLLRDVIERAGPPASRTWVLSGRGCKPAAGFEITLTTPGVDQAPGTAHTVRESHQGRGTSPSLPGVALELIGAWGGSLAQRDGAVSIRFPA